jgi:hypothetical protein
MSLPAWAIRAAGSVVNVGLLALFVVVFVGAISAASEEKEPAWANDKERVAFATGLASYVGGIVAVTLGQKLPSNGGAGDRAAAAPAPAQEAAGRLDRLGRAVASFVPGGVKWLRIGLALGFALVYFGVSA